MFPFFKLLQNHILTSEIPFLCFFFFWGWPENGFPHTPCKNSLILAKSRGGLVKDKKAKCQIKWRQPHTFNGMWLPSDFLSGPPRLLAGVFAGWAEIATRPEVYSWPVNLKASNNKKDLGVLLS